MMHPYINGYTQKKLIMNMTRGMKSMDYTETERIEQLKARVKELETAMDELACSAFNVVKYFAQR